MEPFASAGLSKPTGYNNTKPTWFHIPWTHMPDFVTEGDTDEDTRNAGPPYFSSFEILVQLLINSDLPAQIAIFQLLLDQRCSVPLLVPYGKTYYTQFRTEQIIHRLSPGLSYLGDVLDFVTVKLANQKILSISEDKNLPRVVFVSDRKVLSSRETPDMASDVMNCQFISKYSKNDTGDGPVVEVGVGFLATPGDQPHKHMPCLVLCVWGDHDQLGEFLEKVADIVIVETEPTQEPRVLIWAGGHQDIDVLYWNIDSTARRRSNKNGKHMMCGSFKDLTGDIAIYLMAVISNKNFKASEGGTTSLKECLPRQIQPLNLKVATSNVTDLDATNLERIKDDFLLQKSFAREAKNFFESLRLKGDQAALKQRQNQIQQEKGYRASETDNVMRLPILGNFIELLKEKHDLKRKIGIRQFQLSINKKLQPMVEKAAKKVDDAFEAFQQQPEDLELKQTYYSAKGEHVDQMLGLEHLTLDSLQKFRIDPDEEKSDVKFFGNLKKSNVPPFDVPDWEYGIKVVKLREYINNRVLHGGWESHGLKAWTKYLCMVWDCIADANFELGFLNSIEYTHYHELQTRLARCRQIVGHKWLEELEILEGTLQGAIRSELEMSTIGLMKTLKSKVEDTIKEETREVDKILQQKQCHKWKVEETSHWGNFCSDQERQWMKRLEDCVDGVVKFDSVVKDYNNKIRVEIESDAKRYEDLTAKDRETKMKDHFENNIFKRILREAEEKYPSEEPTIPQRVLAQYRKHQVVGHRHTFNESEASSVVTKWTTLIHGQKLNISEEKHIYNELISKVESCLEDTKQYADHLVLEVIQFTEMLTEGKGKSVQQTFHNLAKDVLTLRLQAIQLEWDKHHNVAKRLEMEHARLWQFFQNCANRVGGTKVLSDEVVNLLNHNLLESFKVLLTKRVCDQLQGEAWVTNWRVMKAHLDLQLINLIEEQNIDELLTCVANGILHHERVVGIQIQEALNKTLDQNELWPWFVEEIKYAVKLAASAARIRNVQQKSILFHGMLKELLCKTSSELAKTISLVDVYSQVEDVIDFSAVGEKVSEEINHVQPDLTSSISELVQKVKTRLIMCESECARPRCEQMCPLCAVTCIHSSGHSGKHHTVHQPQGLIGYHNHYTKCLVPESCTQSVALSTRATFKAPEFGINSYVPYKDFEKHFPQWVLPTEFSSRGLIKLREYIFARYQKNLVEKYWMAKICSNIPSEYKNHNLKELRHELENFIALNS